MDRVNFDFCKLFFLFSFFVGCGSLLFCDEELVNIKYKLNYIDAREFLNALPEELKRRAPQMLGDKNTIVLRCTREEKKIFLEYARLLDIRDGAVPIRLKYINSDELMRFLPPSVSKDDIIITSNPNILFFKGGANKLVAFKEDLSIIDEAKAQVKYQLLVVQYEKSNNFNWTRGLEVDKTDKRPFKKFSGIMSNIFNISFDIVSKFDYQFITKLNFELADNKARVLADTTLNGLSGEEVRFQNTNTFRYVDQAKDSNNKPLYGALREITSGLMVNIKGDVSGDGMVTMDVNAQVSKQGRGSNEGGVLPPTSEKIVRTKVRTQSGTPIIIGGLLQVEKNIGEKKIPGLGDIPVLGYAFKDVSMSETLTEMVIYIIPYIEKKYRKVLSQDERLRRLYEKYIK